MPITYHKGDLFENLRDGDVIVHVVSNVPVFEAGFAAGMNRWDPMIRGLFFDWLANIPAAQFEGRSNTDGWPPKAGDIQILRPTDQLVPLIGNDYRTV